MSNDKTMTIHVEGYDMNQVDEWITEQVSKQVREKIDAKVVKEVAASVRALADERTRERVTAEIEAVFAEGWTETDNYGSPTGKTFTLRERVKRVFETKNNDSYSNDRGKTLVDKWLSDAIAGAMKKMVDEEIAAARVRFREAFDEVLRSKFTTTIRDALGVK